jgi:hypothetical protein
MVLWNSASESLSLLLEEAGPEGEVVENIEVEVEPKVGTGDLGVTPPCTAILGGFRRPRRRTVAQMGLRNQCKIPKDL